MSKRLRWASPQLHADDEGHRKASWLILFYDLVYVITIVRLTTILHHDVSWDGVGEYILLFIPIWWVWVGTTTYDHLFAVDDISHRIFIFLQMIPAVILAVNVTEALHDTSQQFALAYIAARLLLTALWLRAGFRNPQLWATSRRLAFGYSISILFWLVSLAAPEPWKFVFWGVGLGVDLLTAVLVSGDVTRYIRRFAHLAERYGLIIIIVLGESIISIVRARIEGHEGLSIEFAITGILGMIVAFTIWWLYFDQITERNERQGPRHIIAWSYGHLPLVMGIAAVGAAMNFTVTEDPVRLPSEVHWLLVGAVATVLISIGLLEMLGAEQPKRIDLIFRFGGALLALSVGLIEGPTGSVALLLLLLAIMIAQIVQGQLTMDDDPSPAVAGEHA